MNERVASIKLFPFIISKYVNKKEADVFGMCFVTDVTPDASKNLLQLKYSQSPGQKRVYAGHCVTGTENAVLLAVSIKLFFCGFYVLYKVNYI